MNGLGHLAFETDTTINGKTSISSFDRNLRQWTFTSPAGRSSQVSLNEMGRPLLLERAGIAPVHYEYDAQGRLEFITQGTGNQERTQHFSYQNAGFLNTVTDGLQQSTNFTSDNIGLVTQVTRPDEQDINFAYDAKGNTLGITPAGKTEHQFKMSPVDLVDSYQPPALASETTVDTIYTYNLDKDLTQITRPDNKSIIYDYNPTKGQLKSISIPARTYNLAYDANSGLLNHIDWSNSDALDYTYDGLLPTSETWTGIIAGSLGFDYDNNFRQVQLTLNENVTISLSYDNDSLLIQAGELIINRNSNSGFIESLDLANTQTLFSYNDFGELANQTESSAGSLVYSASFTRDNLGHITDKTEKVQNGETDDYRYEYDVVGRLANVYKNNNLTDSYNYDANGNRLSHNDINATYDAQDRLLTYGTASYSYNANGDLESKTDKGITTTYQYDAMGNLLKVTLPGDSIIEYLIDGQNRRIGKKLNGNLVQGFLYQDQLNPVAELNSDNSIKSVFVYADKDHVPAYMIRNGINYKLITNHLGSVRMVINISNGAVEQRIDYDAFGVVINDTNPGFQPFGFAGGLYESLTGLVRFGSRDYDAETGRWIAKDPIGFNGGQGNFYGYVNQNPIMNIDPTGLKLFPSVTAAGTGGFGIVSGEGGSVFLVDPCTLDVYSFLYAGGGFGLGFGGAATIEVGAIEADSPLDITGLGLAAGGFAAAGPGVTGQISGSGPQDTTYLNVGGGVAGGAGAGVAGLVTYTWFQRVVRFADAPAAVKNTLGSIKADCGCEAN